MQKISNFFLINFLKQDVLYINKKNKIAQINPIYFLINLKQILRLKHLNLPIGVYIADKQCRIILQNFLKNTNILFLSDDSFSNLTTNVSIVFFIQTSIVVKESFMNSVNHKKHLVIKINNQINTKQNSESFYFILLDSFCIKNIFFLISFFRFFVKV